MPWPRAPAAKPPLCHPLGDDLNIEAAKVHLLAVPSATMAFNSTTAFHRLFGDTGAPATPTGGTPGTDFEAFVNTRDIAFRAAFNKPAGGGYQPFLDHYLRPILGYDHHNTGRRLRP